MTKTRAEQTAERREQFARRFYQELGLNYTSRHFTLSQFAAEMGMRYNRASEKIVICTGKTFRQHLQQTRAQKLRALIEAGRDICSAEKDCGLTPKSAHRYIDHPSALSKQSRQRLRDQRLHDQLFG